MPLREGGSLPAIVEADDGFLYAAKFRGAGQGVKSLVAEFIGCEVARTLELKVPEVVFAKLNEGFGRTEPDEEIQDLLKASTGMNLGVHYLSGAITFDPAANQPDPLFASSVLWLDAFLMNVDRTPRNTNMLVWKKETWLIDHGASLYFHHSWSNIMDYIDKPFVQVSDHVFTPFASEMDAVDERLASKLTREKLSDICSAIPDELLSYPESASPEEVREVYFTFLTERLKRRSVFVNYAKSSHESLV